MIARLAGLGCALALGCAAPELPLPPGGICLDVSDLTEDQTEALLVASERWEPHFEPVKFVWDPSCANHAENSVAHELLVRPTKAVTVVGANLLTMERTDTQLLLRPGIELPRAWLEDVYTHELAHVFGLLHHTEEGLLSLNPALGTGLTPSEEDRERIGSLYR